MSTSARFPTITREAPAALRARIGQPVRRAELYPEVATPSAFAARAIQEVYRTTFTNQRSEITPRGSATVALPRRGRS